MGWALNDVLASKHHVEGLAWRGWARGRGCHVGVGAAQRGLVWMVPGRNYRVGTVLVLYVGEELLVGISRGRG